MSALVEVQHLTRRFDVSAPWLSRLIEGRPREYVSAVTDVSFAIARGQTYGLVGESGSGKSTVAKLVVGLLAPSAGDVRIDGEPVHGSGRKRRRLGRVQMIFQDPYASLDPRWRVGGIIAEPLTASETPGSRADVRARTDELLGLVGLNPADAQKYPHEFSGGQRQRIAIARALASQPSFIACDEPTSALDVSVQAQVLNLMRDLQDQFGLTYLLISHNLAVVRHMADRIGVMYFGRVVEEAPAKALFRRPRHPYTRMLLEAVPDIRNAGRPRRPIEGEIPSPIHPPPGCPFHPRCPHVFDRCRIERPELGADGESLAACHAVAEGRI